MSDETEDPKSPQMSPYIVELEKGKRYFFCTCGRSEKQPFCDGSHKGTKFEPVAFVAEESGPANLCGCKLSDEMPFCDGTHLMY